MIRYSQISITCDVMRINWNDIIIIIIIIIIKEKENWNALNRPC